MATLVFSTVGSALGGPVGGAIGALIGQSIDQQLLGPANRGARLGDLDIQSSNYGTQIPRIYGTMRVAGRVIWATDPVEAEGDGGAKGSQMASAYSVSLAIALSSRPIVSIGRIWADGKLLRGADGTLKVGGTLRLHLGREEQGVDPLIGSVEGIANTPAYRGVALAVFEDLQLAEFGNRIPFLTAEVVADAVPPALGAVLRDVTDERIAVTNETLVAGYAAYGDSRRAAVAPLVDAFGIDIFDNGVDLVEAPAAPLSIEHDDLVPADNQGCGRHFEQAPAGTAAGSIRLRYYEAARDYQTSEARAVSGSAGQSELSIELPAVISSPEAKTMAQQMLARKWAERDSLKIRLPARYLGILPGGRVSIPSSPIQWSIKSCRTDGFASVAELTPVIEASGALAADPGRIAKNPDVSLTGLALSLIDAADPFGPASTTCSMLLAASSSSPGWKQIPIQIEAGGQGAAAATSRVKSVLGQALDALQQRDSDLIDCESSVEVQLLDSAQWLVSCDDVALAGGNNLAAVGDELIQFGSAQFVGEGRFRLSRLLRGRGGTEWATGSHAAGERFVMLRPGTLQVIPVPTWAMGSRVAVSGGGAETSTLFAGNSVAPPSPARLVVEWHTSGALALTWVRRSRAGWAWLDNLDAPVGEAREEYSVQIDGAAGSREFTSTAPQLLLTAADLAGLGSGPARIAVRQLGDFAASRAASCMFNLV